MRGELSCDIALRRHRQQRGRERFSSSGASIGGDNVVRAEGPTRCW
jgi:hypothetical protein